MGARLARLLTLSRGYGKIGKLFEIIARSLELLKKRHAQQINLPDAFSRHAHLWHRELLQTLNLYAENVDA